MGVHLLFSILGPAMLKALWPPLLSAPEFWGLSSCLWSLLSVVDTCLAHKQVQAAAA